MLLYKVFSNSINIFVVNMGFDVGVDKVVDILKCLGVEGCID